MIVIVTTLHVEKQDPYQTLAHQEILPNHSNNIKNITSIWLNTEMYA